jgi:hypothetical protein
MLKNPALAYKMGRSGWVASDTTNVCWNVESASLIWRETFGKLDGTLPSLPASDLPASDASDVRIDAGTADSVIDTRPLSPDALIHQITARVRKFSRDDLVMT